MSVTKKIIAMLSLVVMLSMMFGGVMAEDGVLFRRNVSMTPDLETAVLALYDGLLRASAEIHR